MDQVSVVRGERLECADTPAMPVPVLAKALQHLLERRVLLYTGQGVQISFRSPARDLGPAVEVSDSAA